MPTYAIYGARLGKNPCMWEKKVVFWLAPFSFRLYLFMSYSQINPGDPAIYFFQRAVGFVRHFARQELGEEGQA